MPLFSCYFLLNSLRLTYFLFYFLILLFFNLGFYVVLNAHIQLTYLGVLIGVGYLFQVNLGFSSFVKLLTILLLVSILQYWALILGGLPFTYLVNEIFFILITLFFRV